MPRREILTSTERMPLLAFPEDEGELIRKYTLTKADLALVRQHRGDHNGLQLVLPWNSPVASRSPANP